MAYVFLIVAIVLEVVATSALQASQQFTRPLPVTIMLAGYGTSFYLLSLALMTLPVGIAYAIWSGLGIVLISLVGFVWFKQALDAPAVLGLGLIVAGVIVVNVFSKSVPH
ncbi:multidrug transporter [Skermanella stibiiresistens SB22]|uniref:Multidrug transporter n=2 Tax=Skermanella TaxID=204447 RepID=W9GZW6_9PROT|nr:multidrug efflux SMR transporter [Skermanella stibiiresistens]EWY39354.1 multidrug transporter [Skermanella stibiiresistens SB22]